MSSITERIKEEAKGKGIAIQDSKSEDLCKVLNQMFYLPKNIDGETKFIHTVMTRGQETQERKGLHASALIVSDKSFCLRNQVLSLFFHQLQSEQLPVGLLRIFEEGNAVHEKWQRLFIRAGYSNYRKLDVTQFNKEYRISFTPDIICKIPEIYGDEEALVEIKSVNTYQFSKMDKHPSASKQLQWYMFLTGIHQGFVLCDDKNNQSFKVEMYKYDHEVVDDFIERAENIKYHANKFKKEKKMVNRPKDAKNQDCKRCKECAMRNVCWNIGNARKEDLF